VKALFRHRCTIERQTVTDIDGFEQKSWSVVKTNQPCLLQERTGRFRIEPYGEELEVDGVIYFPRTVDLKPRSAEDTQDRVTITDPSTPGATFLVLFVADQAGLADKLSPLKAYVRREPAK